LAAFAVVTVVGAIGSVYAAAPAGASCKLELADPIIFVHENPYVIATVNAPADRALEVVQGHRAFLRKAVTLDLVRSDGERLLYESALPPFEAFKKPTDFVRLEPGKSTHVRLVAPIPPTTPGDYTVEARFVPTADEAWVVTARLPLKVTTLDPTAIQWRREWTVTCGQTPWQERVELLNVRSDGAYLLFYRRTSLKRPPLGGVRIMERIEAVDKDTTFAGVPKVADRGDVGEELWFTFDKGGELVFMRIGYVAAETLERTVLKARPEPGAKCPNTE
jgi:hypothetical protein